MNSRQAMDNYNYYRDSRVVASFRSSLLEDINLRSMTADFRHYTSGEEQVDEVKLRFEVCPACQGSGKMVRPVIDAGGLTQEDVEELEYQDPGFMDRYQAGAFDVDCSTCGGRTTVPVLDRKGNSKEVIAAYDKAEREDRAYASMCASERGSGA